MALTDIHDADIGRSDRDVVQEHLLRDGHSERWGQFELPAEATVVGLAGKTGERSDAFDDIAQSFERDRSSATAARPSPTWHRCSNTAGCSGIR